MSKLTPNTKILQYAFSVVSIHNNVTQGDKVNYTELNLPTYRFKPTELTAFNQHCAKTQVS